MSTDIATKALKCDSCGAPLNIPGGDLPSTVPCEYCGTSNGIVGGRAVRQPSSIVNERLMMGAQTTTWHSGELELLPTGVALDDVYTTIKRSELAMFRPTDAFRWMTLGIVAFMTLIGIYILLIGFGI